MAAELQHAKGHDLNLGVAKIVGRTAYGKEKLWNIS